MLPSAHTATLPPLPVVYGVGNDQRVGIDVGVQCRGRRSCPVEIAADLDIPAAGVAGSVDQRAAHDADIVAKDADVPARVAGSVSTCIDQAAIYHRGCSLLLSLVCSDISGNGVRPFGVKFYSSGFGAD